MNGPPGLKYFRICPFVLRNNHGYICSKNATSMQSSKGSDANKRHLGMSVSLTLGQPWRCMLGLNIMTQNDELLPGRRFNIIC